MVKEQLASSIAVSVLRFFQASVLGGVTFRIECRRASERLLWYSSAVSAEEHTQHNKHKCVSELPRDSTIVEVVASGRLLVVLLVACVVSTLDRLRRAIKELFCHNFAL